MILACIRKRYKDPAFPQVAYVPVDDLPKWEWRNWKQDGELVEVGGEAKDKPEPQRFRKK